MGGDKNRAIPVALSVLVLVFVLGMAPAGAAPWIHSTMGGGGAFSQASVDGDTVWVAADIAGFYRTMNGGRSWTAIGTATPVSGAAVAVKPGDASHVVAGTDGSHGNPFRVSANAIRNPPAWSAPNAAPGWPNFITWGRGRRVWAVGRVAASGAAGPRIWTSPDDGANWNTTLAAGLDDLACPLKIVCHPTRDSVLYLVSGPDLFKHGARKALYKSSDAGGHWSEICAAGLDGRIQDVALDPGSPSTLYATTGDVGTDRDVVLKSTDSGSTWTPIGRRHTGNIAIKAGHVRLINVERPGSREACGPQSECGVWEYDGSRWTHTSDTGSWDVGWATRIAWMVGKNIYGRAKSVAVDPMRPDTMWWVTSRFVLKSVDGGATFRSSAYTTTSASDSAFTGHGLDNISVMSLDGHGRDVVAGYYDNGLWVRTGSGAERWRPINDPIATSCVSLADKAGMALHGDRGWNGAGGNASTCLHLVMGGRYKHWAANGEKRDQQVFLWSDESRAPGGHVWRIAAGLPGNVFISGLSHDPNSPATNLTMYVTAGGYVYKSTDDGHSWRKLEPGPYRAYFTAVDQVNGHRVYAGGRSGFWFSTDAGATWRQPAGGNPFKFNQSQMSQGSCDADTSLGKMCWNGIHDLYARPNGEGTVWAAFYREGAGRDTGGIYRSTDGGNTWVRKLAKPYMQCVTGWGERPDTIWAGQSKLTNASRSNLAGNCGLLRSNDAGVTWNTEDMGISDPCVNRLAIHGAQVWAGVPGQGVYYYDPEISGGGRPGDARRSDNGPGRVAR